MGKDGSQGNPPPAGAGGDKPRRTVHVVHPPGAAPARPPSDGGEDMLSVLRDIRAELQQSRADANQATRRLQEALRTEQEWSRKLLRMMVNEQYKPREDEIAEILGTRQLDFTQTLDVLHRERLSLTRFGDGELLMMADPDHDLRYQRNSAALRDDLAAALNPQGGAQGRVLVALPHLFRGHLHWYKVWLSAWDTLKPLLDPAGRYGNAHVSRPVYFSAARQEAIAQWRRLWEARAVLIVTGRGSRFDPIPELFDGVARIDTLETVAQHAYEQRDAILTGIRQRADADTLVLLSLGPAATALVPQIAAEGLQALDIGHISASYHNAIGAGVAPENMPVTREPGD